MTVRLMQRQMSKRVQTSDDDGHIFVCAPSSLIFWIKQFAAKEEVDETIFVFLGNPLSRYIPPVVCWFFHFQILLTLFLF